MTSEERWELKRMIDNLADVADVGVPYPKEAHGTDATLWTDAQLAEYFKAVSKQVLAAIKT